ncbi:hypothetical protein M4I70_12840, partial [Enterococcus faecium]|nr:hypothetical protein [Enterococcus faecium]
IGNPSLNHRYRKGFYSLFKTLQQNLFEVLGISLFECYDMTEKLYNEVNEIVSEINNFLNEESSDERKQI